MECKYHFYSTVLLFSCTVNVCCGQAHSDRQAVNNRQERSIASNNTAALSALRSISTEEKNKRQLGRIKTSLPYALGTTLHSLLSKPTIELVQALLTQIEAKRVRDHVPQGQQQATR
jgi:hypothetical protein